VGDDDQGGDLVKDAAEGLMEGVRVKLGVGYVGPRLSALSHWGALRILTSDT
jgi:hypothetical protein